MKVVCGNCKCYMIQSEYAGICTNPESVFLGTHVGKTASCGKWCQESENKECPTITKAERLCKRCFHCNMCASIFKENLLIEELLCGKLPMCSNFVEIIPCKDCKHHETEATESGKEYIYCGLSDEVVEADDFCSRCERRCADEE